MSRSIESDTSRPMSERPILKATDGNRASKRFSTYSKAASEAPTIASTATDPEIKEFDARLKRLEDQRLERQRYHMTAQQMDEHSKLALVGKVQRSLERRYTNQDATMKPRVKQLSEKV